MELAEEVVGDWVRGMVGRRGDDGGGEMVERDYVGSNHGYEKEEVEIHSESESHCVVVFWDFQ